MSYLQTINNFAKLPSDPTSAFKIPSYPSGAATALSETTGMFNVLGMGSDPLATTLSAANDSWMTYANTTIPNIGKNLSILQSGTFAQDHIARVDALYAGNLRDGAADNPNLQANSVTCRTDSFVSKGMAALRQGAKIVGEALTGVASAMKDVFGSIVTGLKAAMGWAHDTIGAVVDAFNSAAAEVKLLIQQAAGVVAAGFAAAFQAAKDVAGAIAQAATDAFNAVKDAAANAIAEATALIKSKNLLGFLNSNDPCVQDIMGDVVNTANIDQKALDIAKTI